MVRAGYAMMSENGGGSASGGAGYTNGENREDDDSDIRRVLDALATFIDDADHLGGFVVKYASARPADRVLDRSTVEVVFHYPDRHPNEADRVMGMLQGHGFEPERGKRGGQSTTCVVLSVPVGEDSGEGEDSPSESGGSDEQSAL